MSQNNLFRGDQMSEQEVQQFLADCLPLQDVMICEGAMLPDPASRALMKRSGVPLAMTAVWVDASKRPDVLQELNRFQGTESAGESVCTWVYLHEDREECSFVLEVDLRKPTQLQFRIPIRVAEWGDLLDIVSLTASFTVYVGPPPDWRTMIQQMEPAQVLEQVKNGAHGDVTLTLGREAVHDMRQHYGAWCKRFQPESIAQMQPEIPFRFLIEDVSDLTRAELAEGLMNIARQLQQMPANDVPLQGNITINGAIAVESQTRSAASLRFSVEKKPIR